MKTKYLVYCFLLPPVGVKRKEQESLGCPKKGALLPAVEEASLPSTRPSHILRVPNCFSLQMINSRTGVMAFQASNGFRLMGDLHGPLFSARCLITCPEF